MSKKIITIFFIILVTNSIAITGNGCIYGEPPDEWTHHSNSNKVSDWRGMDVQGPNNEDGTVVGVEDNNNNGIVDEGDNVIIKWKNPKFKEPYCKYSIDAAKYVDDPEDENYGRWKFELDRRSKSKNPPKIKGCCYYVNCDNTAGPWDGTINNPWQTIGEAIYNAEICSNIYVSSGTYQENIVIDKNLNIIGGEDESSSPIIDGGVIGSVVTIISDSIFIGGFTIENSGNLEEDAGIDIKSDNNIIAVNYIINCINGIYLHDSANGNWFYENNIENNDFGFFISDNCLYNIIWNNNFLNSKFFHCKDLSTNNWNDENVGNYYDDYTGTDSDSDGIGDTPYEFSGGQDNFPLIDRWEDTPPEFPIFEGPSTGIIGVLYNFTISCLDSDDDDMSYTLDWGDDTDVETGSIFKGEIVTVEHKFIEKGDYEIVLTAYDKFHRLTRGAKTKTFIVEERPKSYIDFFVEIDIEKIISFEEGIIKNLKKIEAEGKVHAKGLFGEFDSGAYPTKWDITCFTKDSLVIGQERITCVVCRIDLCS